MEWGGRQTGAFLKRLLGILAVNYPFQFAHAMLKPSLEFVEK